MSSTAAIILAAGKSTRMRSKLPKPLHPVCGLPMTAHLIRACRAAGVERIVVVVGHEAEKVKAGLGGEVEYALQETPRGTGDAVRAAQPLLGDWTGAIAILAGDTPLLPAEMITRLLERQRATGATTLLTAFLDDPTGYGRVIRDADGKVQRIVEERDATPEEKTIKEWFPSIYAFQGAALWETLAQIEPNNAQGEYYLTDTVKLMIARGETVQAVPLDDADDVLGVNTRVELAKVSGILRERILHRLMLSGVTITDPATTYVEADVVIGQDTTLEPNTHLVGKTTVGEDCVLGPGAYIENSALQNGVRVRFAQVIESVLENDVRVGPFAHLRKGTHLGPKVKIGDFVETKNAIFGERAQASHLAYIGDAEIGARTNIGAGTITCNYDGYKKYKTIIGARVFVGSNSTLIAQPGSLTIGDGAFIAAGSLIEKSIPSHAMGIGRARTEIKEGWAQNYHTQRQQDAAETQATTDDANSSSSDATHS